jgi:hypothetical protein
VNLPPAPRTSGLFCVNLALLAAACESSPGEKRQQGAVIGGVGGAAGAILTDEDHRLLGAVIGGALGAGGGYLIGRRMDAKDDQAPIDVQRNQFTTEQVKSAATADLDSDGNVTLAEIVAMDAANLTDDEINRAPGQLSAPGR